MTVGRLRFLGLVVLSIGLAGCLSQPLATDKAAGIRSVAILSLLPEELSLRKVGSLDTNAQAAAPIGARLNESARQAVLREVARLRPDIKLQLVEIDVKELREKIGFRREIDRISADLARIAGERQVDALLVVHEGRTGHSWGVEITMHSLLGHVHQVWENTPVSVYLVDRGGATLAFDVRGENRRRYAWGEEADKFDNDLSKNLTDPVISLFLGRLEGRIVQMVSEQTGALGLQAR